MPKVNPEESELLARKQLDKQMAGIEELFSVARAQATRPSPDRLKVVRNLLQYHVVKISRFLDFLDEYKARGH